MIKQSVSRALPLLMLDSSGVAVTGLAFGDVSVKYAKAGAASLTTKSLAASPVEWIEIGQGLYEVVFTSAELNTIGFFKFLVTGGAAIQGSGLADISANLVDDVKADTVAIQAQTDGLNFDGANVLAVVADKGVLNNPPSESIADYRADVSALALEATLTAMKGAGWSTETLKAIMDGITAFTTENYNGSGF